MSSSCEPRLSVGGDEIGAKEAEVLQYARLFALAVLLEAARSTAPWTPARACACRRRVPARLGAGTMNRRCSGAGCLGRGGADQLAIEAPSVKIVPAVKARLVGCQMRSRSTSFFAPQVAPMMPGIRPS